LGVEQYWIPDTKRLMSDKPVSAAEQHDRHPQAAADKPVSAAERDNRHRQAAALRICRENMRWYQQHGLLAMTLYRGTQTATILLGAASAVLVAFTDLPKFVQATPAAVASLAAGLNGLYGWREDWVRWLATAQALRTELNNYEARNPDGYGTERGDSERLDHFVQRVDKLVTGETQQWQNLEMKPVRRGRRQG
jgi:hypothetical protein